MFEAWGRRVYAWRWGVLVASALFLVASLVVLARGGRLTTAAIAGIETDRAVGLLRDELPAVGGTPFTVIFRSPTLTVDDPRFRDAMLDALAPVRDDPRVVAVNTPYGIPGPGGRELRSLDGHAALAIVTSRDAFTAAARYYPELRARIHSPTLETIFTDGTATDADVDRYLELDLRRAEKVTIPVACVLLLLVFGTLVAALIPVGVGSLAVLGGVAGVYLLSRFTSVAQYAVNIVSLVGLGVAIDYSLFIVKRYQEELGRGAEVSDAVARTVGTAGRSVAFSGLAVLIGLSGLLFYRGSYLSSIGLGGAIVVGFAVLYAMTFLPALLAVLGRRIHWGGVPRFSEQTTQRAWHHIATWVMQRPVQVLVPTLAFMLLLGSPFLHLQVATPNVLALPPRAEARRGEELMFRQFPHVMQPRVVVVVYYPHGRVFTPERVGALYDLSRRIAAVPGVARVDGAVNYAPSLGRADYERLASFSPDLLPPAFQALLNNTVGEHVAVLFAVARPGIDRVQAVSIVRAVRTMGIPDGEVLVTGRSALEADTQDFVRAHTPAAVLFVLVMTYVVLFVLLRSVLLPLKAVAMNVLSITGSFGALVWVFQEGHLANVLKFTPGPIDPTLPVVLFCAVFGLSMDYEVLLLSRMQEEYARTGDNTRAVAGGLERSGRLITSAAMIMVAVFAGFGIAEVVHIKALGLGMALAVALDATIVRILIVPATMRLLGSLNWWAPAPLAHRDSARLAEQG